MPLMHITESIDFLLGEGKTKKQFGSYSMKGNEVFSYSLKLATVDREQECLLLLQPDEAPRSQTTSRHRNSIIAAAEQLKWTIIWEKNK